MGKTAGYVQGERKAMTLRAIGLRTPIGQFYCQDGFRACTVVAGTATVDMKMLTKRRQSALILSLKRGFSRGTEYSEQYLLYKLLCNNFGMRPARISNARNNVVPVPHNTTVRDFYVKVIDTIEPLFRLTDEHFDKEEMLGYNDYWWKLTDEFNNHSVRFTRPAKVSMLTLGKYLKQIMIEPDFAKVCEAVEFVKNGGTIQYKF
jgi:hypothetical protein